MPAATFIVIDPPSNTPQHHRLRPSAQPPRPCRRRARSSSLNDAMMIPRSNIPQRPGKRSCTTTIGMTTRIAGSLIVADAGMNPRVPNALQIRVALVGIEPAIWRRLIVPRSFHLGQLHRVIQAAFGWRGLPPARVPHRRLVLS